MCMKYILDDNDVMKIEQAVNRGSRAEVAVEKGKIVIVEIRRKKLD